MRAWLRILLAGSLMVTAAVLPLPSHAATFDGTRTDVAFTYYVGYFSQSGHFTQMNGVIQFDPRSPQKSSIVAVIKTASLTADAWETELKGSDFFNIAVFPEIRFQSNSVRLTGLDTAEFAGDLTMNGITRPVTLQANFGGGRHISAKTRINRSAFNMTAFSFLAADAIDIKIEADLLEK
jgi:polyisoprenoid-binding protein YceI